MKWYASTEKCTLATAVALTSAVVLTPSTGASSTSSKVTKPKANAVAAPAPTKTIKITHGKTKQRHLAVEQAIMKIE